MLLYVFGCFFIALWFLYVFVSFDMFLKVFGFRDKGTLIVWVHNNDPRNESVNKDPRSESVNKDHRNESVNNDLLN